MRSELVLVAVGVLVGASAALGYAALRDDDATADAQTVAELAIEPSTTDGPQGVGLLRGQDGRLSGSVVVWGLEPGTRHAVHFHGPNSARNDRRARPARAAAERHDRSCASSS